MENIETRIEELKAEIEYQGRVVKTSQVGSLTHVIAKLRLEESLNMLDTLEMDRELDQEPTGNFFSSRYGDW